VFSLEEEATVLKKAIVEMSQRGYSHVIFESDSQVVIDVISSRQRGVSDFNNIISVIKSLLHLHNNFEVKFVKR
jgi:hypothetical protein